MGIGTSGRIVIEVDTATKRELYSALVKEGITLKDWFLLNTENYLRKQHQLTDTISDEQGKKTISDTKSS